MHGGSIGESRNRINQRFPGGPFHEVRFVNADLIAGGLSPLRPQLAAIAAGRLLLNELDRLANSGVVFALCPLRAYAGLCGTGQHLEGIVAIDAA